MSTFTVNKNIEQPASNSYIDTWATPVNADWALIDTCLGGSIYLNSTGLSGPQTLTISQYQPLTIRITGTPTAAITYVVPAGVGGQWIFVNATSGGFDVGLASAAGGATVLVPAASNNLLSCDGTSLGMRPAVNQSGSGPAGGTNTQVQFNSGGILAGSAGFIFDGTTLSVTGLSIGGNTILGNGSGSTLTIYGTAVAIPNTLNIGSNNLFLNGTQVGIGTITLAGGNLLTVAGNIKITTGGLVFSDGTQLLTAASISPGGAGGNVQYNNGSGGFGASGAFTFNAGPGTLSVTNLTLAGALTGATTINASGAVTAASLVLSGAITGATTIAASSNVTVGGALTVTGNITVGGSGAGAIGFGTGGATNINLSGGTLSAALSGGANWALTPSAFAVGAGLTCFNTSGAWVATSDARLKTNPVRVEPRAAVLNIMALTPTDFDWVTPAEGRPARDRGFIAQEYAAVYPADVSVGPDGYLALAISRAFHADIVAMLQNQQYRIDELERIIRDAVVT
jgi:hypothetical protein